MSTANISPRWGDGKMRGDDRSPSELRRDRIVLSAIVAILVALMALVVWLSSIGVLPSGVGGEGAFDYWMMP